LSHRCNLVGANLVFALDCLNGETGKLFLDSPLQPEIMRRFKAVAVDSPATIRRLTSGDTTLLREIASLQDIVFQRVRHNRLAELEHIISECEMTAMFIASCGRSIVGFIHIRCMNTKKHVWMVRGIGVASGCRRRGTGRNLLNTAVVFIKDRGGTELRSCVDSENIPSLMLHRRYGFIEKRDDIYGMSKLRVNFVLNL